jgi:hypothetical protein
MDAPEEIRARLRAMAKGELDALIDEACAEARAHVKAVLRDAYTDELLQQATGAIGHDPGPEPATRSPASSSGETDGHGLWVYCVVRADRELPHGLDDVVLGGPPRLLAAGGLAALASHVPLAEFGEAPLRQNLNDLAWLERTVRAHEAVLDSMIAGGAVVPMRVCTIYRDDAQVGDMLESRGALFQDALRRLAGKAEWGVKIVADRGRLEQHARSQSETARSLGDDITRKPEGGAYLARKKLAALVRDEADGILNEIVRETHARLEEWAAGSVVLPAQNRELSGYEGEMVFNGAYLVEDERVHAFSSLLDELGSQYAPLGLTFDLTGPWPAYNFANAGSVDEVRG